MQGYRAGLQHGERDSGHEAAVGFPKLGVKLHALGSGLAGAGAGAFVRDSGYGGPLVLPGLPNRRFCFAHFALARFARVLHVARGDALKPEAWSHGVQF